MTDLPAKNAPTGSAYNAAPTTFSFDMVNADVQIAYLPSRPFSVVFSDHTKATIAVTASPAASILAGTAIWGAITVTAALLSVTTPVTAIRITASGALKADLCV